MKMHVEVEMTPEEARGLMGLPDVAPLQKQMMDEIKARMTKAMEAGDMESLMRAWSPLGGRQGLRPVPEIPLGQRPGDGGGKTKEKRPEMPRRFSPWPARRAGPGWRWCGFPVRGGRGLAGAGGANCPSPRVAGVAHPPASRRRNRPRPGALVSRAPTVSPAKTWRNSIFMAGGRCAKPCSRRWPIWVFGPPSRGNFPAARWKMAGWT